MTQYHGGISMSRRRKEVTEIIEDVSVEENKEVNEEIKEEIIIDENTVVSY